jgi:hypothetical protein
MSKEDKERYVDELDKYKASITKEDIMILKEKK